MKRDLAARLEEVVARAPDRVALREPGGAPSYAGLWADIVRLADEMSTRGADAGAVVLIANPNSAAWLTTFFAALRAGSVVAVVDPKLPAEQRDQLEASLDPIAVLVGDTLKYREASPPPAGSPCPDFRSAGGRILYFTSGSTGLPKGVLLSEETILANVEWNTELLGLGRDDVGCLYLPLSHSYNLVFALCFLLAGSVLVLERDLSDLHGTLARVDAAGATVMQNVPTSLRTLVERADLERWPLQKCRAVRVGAGVLTDDLAAQTFRAFPRASIVATYGMTELGLVASRTWTACPIAESTFDRLVPGLGLDVQGEGDEREGEGEILVSHPLLFLGYFDAAARSLAVRQGPHRTGDLGQLTVSGSDFARLTLRSRRKAVAKVAGVLINLDEVSKIACRLEGVVDACALGLPHPVLGEAVHLFLAQAEGRPVDTGQVVLRIMEETLLRTAPRVHVLDRLPRADSGKVARGALEAIARAGAREP